MFSSSVSQQGGYNNFGYPVNQFSYGVEPDGVKEDMYQEPNFCEIQSQGGFVSSNFSQGTYDFIVTTGNQEGVIFNRSFFRVEMTLETATTVAGTFKQPIPAEHISLCAFAPACLWSNVSFSISNQEIDKSTQYCGECSTIVSRLGYGSPLLYNNSDLFLSDPYFDNRMALTCDITDPNQVSTFRTNLIRPYLDEYAIIPKHFPTDLELTIAYTHVGTTLTLAVTAGTFPNVYGVAGVSFAALGITVGSTLILNDNGTLRTFTVSSVTSNTVVVVNASAGGANIAAVACTSAAIAPTANVGWIVVRTRANANSISTICGLYAANQNRRTVLYQPNLGIFQLSEPLAGEFKISLTPNQEYQSMCVQSIYNNLVAGTDYRVTINNVRFYAYVVKKAFSPERPLLLNLLEQTIYQRRITGVSHDFEWTIPPSTRSIAIFFGDSRSGRRGGLSVPVTEFRSLDGLTSEVQVLQVNYGGMTIPKKSYNTIKSSSTLTPTAVAASNVIVVSNSTSPYEDNYQLRYVDYMMSTGKIFSEGGAESYQDWTNSPIYFYDFNFASGSVATNLSTYVKFGSTPGVTAGLYYANMYVCAFYTTVVKGQYSSNILSGVISANV